MLKSDLEVSVLHRSDVMLLPVVHRSLCHISDHSLFGPHFILFSIGFPTSDNCHIYIFSERSTTTSQNIIKET